MPQTSPSEAWMTAAIACITAGYAVQCWRCAITVQAEKVNLPGRCSDVCPLNAAAKAAANRKAA